MQHPIDAFLDDIATAASTHNTLLIKAAPGAGKTTRVPPRLLQDFRRILVVQPRRLAAKLTATWVAAQLDSQIGETVGYQIKLENRSSSATRLLFVTEGILTRKMMQDPLLRDWDLVILDEFHERHIQTDVGLALLLAAQQQRPDLRLVIMSATLDNQGLEQWLDGCKTFDVPGKSFPVELEHRSMDARTYLDEHVAKNVRDILTDPRSGDGNILVFLPGRGEIERVASRLESLRDVDVIPLTAELAQNHQLIGRDNGRRKVVLSTNVAETSVTLPNISGVVDSGLARVSGHASGSGLPTLDIQKVSQASCVQRAGRAGRTRAGVCYRLFSQFDFGHRPAFTEPEIRRIDLSQTLLELATIFPATPRSWEKIQWYENPDPRITQQNVQLLQQLGALDPDGHLTDLGRKTASLPLHPRLARMVLAGQSLGAGEAALLGALIINEGLILREEEASTHASCDICHQTQVFIDAKRHRQREWILDRGKVARIEEQYKSLASQLKMRSWQVIEEVPEKEVRRSIFAGFADRVARYRPLADTGKKQLRAFNFCQGRGASLAPQSVVADEEWIAVVDAREAGGDDPTGTRGRIYAACTIESEWLTQDPFQLTSEEETTILDGKTGQPRRVRQHFYGKLLYAEKEISVSAEAVEQTLFSRVMKDWPQSYGDITALKIYHAKLDLLDKHQILHKLPRFEGDMLELLIDYLCAEAKSLSEVKGRSLSQAIAEQLDYDDHETLRRECPNEIKLAHGRRVSVTYTEGEPWIGSRIQDFFGQKDTPTICAGRQPLLCKLLAPNQRPAQITSDLHRFWEGSYHEIKKELKRRYPRHAWPDDPATWVPPPKNT